MAPTSDEGTSGSDPPRTRDERAIERFALRGGFTGRLESVGDLGPQTLPSDDTVREMASNLASAASDDPLLFQVLGEHTTEEGIGKHLSEAVGEIRKDGRAAQLTGPQRGALEAIVLLTGRPALFVKKDDIALPEGVWELLAPYRPAISKVARSVGRIGIQGYTVPYVGTGFLVGPRLIMTNRHVVEKHIAPHPDGHGWVLDPGVGMKVDFKQEFGSAERNEFEVDQVLWVDSRNEVDLALLELKVGPAESGRLPSPLRLQRERGYAAEGNKVYVMGYPAADPKRNDPTEMHRIFEGVYEKKRLAPGRLLSVSTDVDHFSHDCSTLGGNSGSCVIDLSTNSVVGLHFEGNYLESNTAVLLPALAGDPVLTKFELNWQEGRDD